MADEQANDDRAWRALREAWSLAPDAIYLNHGSFGPSPRSVLEARLAWLNRIEQQPWDFYIRQLDESLRAAAEPLAQLVGALADDLVFVDNATVGMNVVAASFDLEPGDEVLLTDHEYGAVRRIWENACEHAGAVVNTARLPRPVAAPTQIVDAVMAAATGRTRLLVFSHVTSPTAMILPAAALTHAAHERGIHVCIDGPHALAMLDVDVARIDADYYTASCHKWLSAPFGSGILWVHPRRQSTIRPALVSWGRTPAREHAEPKTWRDEFNWIGTRDVSPYLAVPAAIAFLESVGWQTFRDCTHALARYARSRIVRLTGLEPFVPDEAAWYGSMVTLPLPPGEALPLQLALWQRHRIEVPVPTWNDERWIRVSCHLYTTHDDIDRLVAALAEELS